MYDFTRQELAVSTAALHAARQRAAELERAAMEAAASRQQVEEDARERVERAEAAREHGVASADAQRAALESKVQQLSDRVAELKEDKESLQTTLSEVMGRAGDASLQSEAHWKDRLEDSDANSRRKLEQMRKANEEALAAVTRTFQSEREALCLRVSSLEQQVASSTTTPSFPTHYHPYLISTLPPPGG
jgi:multidrug efflux pump subunit AcrA (membrane-fusion protein)